MKNLYILGTHRIRKWRSPALPKLFWMKVSFIFISFLFTGLQLIMAYPGYGQGLADKKIHLQVYDEVLPEIFKQIENQTSFHFAYNPVATKQYKASVNGVSITVEDALKTVLKDTPFKFKLIGDKILITGSSSQSVVLPLESRLATNVSRNISQKVLTLNVSGTVVDEDGEPLIGVNILVKGTNKGTATDFEGRFELVDIDEQAVLVISYVGYQTQEVAVAGKSSLVITLNSDTQLLDEVVVVGYGTQKKSDITGTVSSVPKERLEMMSNINVAQAIQGSVSGITIQTSSAGAEPSLDIMVRGRNSIAANNSPLVVVDGIPYGGKLSDINPNDVKDIEILKDASAAAIYGSRGANGVILISTKQGLEGPATITYDGYFSVQKFTNVPNYMDGPEFYAFKNERLSAGVTASEQAVYDAGEWVDWADLATRQGFSQQHNLSLSGGLGKTSYYVSGGVMDVQGIAINDDYLRGTTRFNLDSKVTDWLTIGTRTQITFSDKSGVAPSMSNVYIMNPLAVPYNKDGTLTILPVADDPARENPLQEIQFENTDKSRRVITNNFAVLDFERFIPGLNFRFNYGITDRVSEEHTYRGRDTYDGRVSQGRADISKSNEFNTILENIFSYKNEFKAHSIFVTALYSIQEDEWQHEATNMENFPNDLLTWNAGGQAGLIKPSFDYIKSTLISQMLRFNYSYDSRYLLTLTGRRDGYSGFGADSKWGIFPSLALGWNLGNEEFFPLNNYFSQLKLRASYGENGNQAVGSYRSIGRLGEENYLSGNTTMAGYYPSTLGQQTLGWESSRTFNIGLDFGILDQRITGDMNFYKTNTYDLLLNRAISSIHGITSILENIGETENRGVEIQINSRNMVSNKFTWTTLGNISYLKNKIVDLYGDKQDDVGNQWFIGQPIRVNFNYVFDGVWQLDEVEEASKWGSQPGYLKLKDVNNDDKITSEDRKIQGQQDPKFLWGLTNTFSSGNLSLSVFLHGVHGVTKQNILMDDGIVTAGVRRNTIVKKWWTPENHSNEWYKNDVDADRMAGVSTSIYENASFVRIKDITLSYDFPKIQKIGGMKLRVYATGHDLFTFTDWRGLDPELNNQRSIPLQSEIVFGLQVGF